RLARVPTDRRAVGVRLEEPVFRTAGADRGVVSLRIIRIWCVDGVVAVRDRAGRRGWWWRRRIGARRLDHDDDAVHHCSGEQRCDENDGPTWSLRRSAGG